MVLVIILTFLTRSLPIALIQHGGLAFLFIYLICLTVVGAPLLLLETSLGKICSNTSVCFFLFLAFVNLSQCLFYWM